MAIDVFTQILKDHDSIEDLYRLFQGETDPKNREKIGNDIIREATVHTYTEEIVVYRAYQEYMPDGKKYAQDSLKEHEDIRKMLAKLEFLKVTDPEYAEMMDLAMKEFVKHVKEEEEEILPRLKRYLNDELVDDLGEEYARIKPTVPQKPKIHD
ncbi:581_t:CDS:2 [Ambispora gerdemannii]|uniref:581_t:CDS:1 n=1 Tax=Ambispora gerdemannii TaxID=144530 RepID=A0A9N9APU7_9GLOM|nr:581_t:CDS:2 [Ambispora gerdemannii]